MHILLMAIEIVRIPDSVIRESSLPHLGAAADQATERMRVPTLNELDGVLDGHIGSGREQEMHMIWHKDKRVQLNSTLATVVVNSFQKQTRIRFNNEEPAPLPRREGHKVRSRRRDRSYRFQRRPQRLKPELLSKSNSARVELVPFPMSVFFTFSFREDTEIVRPRSEEFCTPVGLKAKN